jgi:replicative DNA helicase
MNPYLDGAEPVVEEWHHISEAFKQALDFMLKRKAGEALSLKTPWKNLNELVLDGLPWQSITVVGARPSHGKTLWSTQLSREAFRLNPGLDMAVLDFQLEMSGKDMAGRQMSMQLKKSLKELYSAENGRKISDADFEAAVALAKLYNKAPMTRPKKSLHLLLINPDSNLHIFFNPKYCLLLLNPSLWSGA